MQALKSLSRKNSAGSCLPISKDNPSLPDQWKAKVPVYLEQLGYIIKTADSLDEFNQVLALRREVFLGEFSRFDLTHESDFEPLDLKADFLIVLEKKTNAVIATYRLLCSQYSNEFYSESEFHIESFLEYTESKIELSRACVKNGSRNGVAINLLWRGIAAYMDKTRSRYLFGCSSLTSLDLSEIINLYKFIQNKDAIGYQYKIHPKSNYHMVELTDILNKICAPSVSPKLIPPLLYGYLKAGAKIYGPPAIDLRFSCVDLFTVLDFESLDPCYARKYRINQN